MTKLRIFYYLFLRQSHGNQDPITYSDFVFEHVLEIHDNGPFSTYIYTFNKLRLTLERPESDEPHGIILDRCRRRRMDNYRLFFNTLQGV